ncbi:hypothetical protein DFH09DRAFT_1311794 [Mycena vulgaris]|nr:hypothetical protein DFH09DRAFT_1311794 [Mycena vulgaris]
MAYSSLPMGGAVSLCKFCCIKNYVNDNGDNYDQPNNVFAQVLTSGKLGSTPSEIRYAYALLPTTGLPTARRTLASLKRDSSMSSGFNFAAVCGGVDVYHPDGTRLGKINIPEASPNGETEEKHVMNIVFEGDTLWCFTYGSVYRVPGLLVKGDPRLG